MPVKFELPPSELGHRVLGLHVKAPPGSSDASDKFLEGAVNVSEHQTHVLLLAGGPLRDYQYLRTLLFRDKSMKVDVLLQSGQPGMSQEASNILGEIPLLATGNGRLRLPCRLRSRLESPQPQAG